MYNLVREFASEPIDPITVEQYVNRLENILVRRANHRSNCANNHADDGHTRNLLVNLLQAGSTRGSQFVTHACEIAAADHFHQLYPENFCIEVPSNAGRNFDFTFEADGITFNVEVKTILPQSDSDEKRNLVKFFLPQDQTRPFVRQIRQETGMGISRNCMPFINRALKDANEQLARPKRGITVMLLCCNDFEEQIDALTCFVGPHGILSKTEAAPENAVELAPANVPNVDAVVICNLGHLQAGVLYPDRFAAVYEPADPPAQLHDGGPAWDYLRSYPIALRMQPSMPLDFLVPFYRAFASVYGFIERNRQLNGGDLQAAYFQAINEFLQNGN